MERVNQVVRSGRVRGRLVLLLVLGVLLALLVVGITVMMQRQAEHDAQVATTSEPLSLDAMRPMLAVARLERAGAEEEKYQPLVYELEELTAPPERSADFRADYERYQELTEPKPAPAPEEVSPLQAAQDALAQSRAQALVAALKASTAVDTAAPQAAALPQAAATMQAAALPQAAATMQATAAAPQVSAAQFPAAAHDRNPLHSALAQDGVTQLKNLAGGSTGNPKTLAAYERLKGGATLLKEKVESVLSPYLLRQGVLIPCVLLSGVNSDLPGQVQAQVTSDVFDTPYGRHVLIPKGSKIIGQYASAPLMGQERVMLGFNRVIFPDGKALSLGSMPGASLDGFAGFSAEVDNHMWRLFSNAVLLGGVTAGVSLAVDNDAYDENGRLTLNGALSQGMGQSLGRVITTVIERNLSVSPTLTVAPGFLFNVTLTQDIYFDGPYRGYDYEQQPNFGF